MLKKLCKTIKDNMCKYSNLFGNSTKINSLNIKDGVITLNGYDGVSGNQVTICGDEWQCKSKKELTLSSALIYGAKLLHTTNTILTKYKYSDFEVSGEEYNINVLSNTRILIVPNEKIAFEIFSKNVNNYIFITPIGSSVIGSWDGQSVLKHENIKVIIMLHNAKDINQVNTMSIINDIENVIIENTMTFFQFKNSSFAFSTANTTILEINFSTQITIDRNNDCRCYAMELKYPFIKVTELEKILTIDK